MSDEHDKSSSSDDFQLLDVPYDEFDVLVNDIDEHELEKIGRAFEVINLSAGIFSSSPFPAPGHIREINTRYMIPLVCQWAGKPFKPSINVWFLLETGSPFTCLTMSTMRAIFGEKKEIHEGDFFEVAIQDQESSLECQISRGHFKQVNIFGGNALKSLQLWIRGDWKTRKFELYRQ